MVGIITYVKDNSSIGRPNPIYGTEVLEMKNNVTLGIAAIIAAMTLTAVALSIPQQALSYRHHNNYNNHKNLNVDQRINQLNNCTTSLYTNQANNNFGPPPVAVVWH